MADKYLRQDLTDGAIHMEEATVASAGAADAGEIVALDGTGRLDPSVMPVGIGADTQAITTSEALAAGDYVNIHDVAGAFRVRKADASALATKADGFVLAAFGSAVLATVYFEGTNTQVTGQTPGTVYLSETAGIGTGVAGIPTAAGTIVQPIGVATSATTVNFEAARPVVLA